MFSFETRRILKKFLTSAISAELTAESLRQRLSKRPYFSVSSAFHTLDLNDNGFITLDEF